MKSRLRNELAANQAWEKRRAGVFHSDFGTIDGSVSPMHGVADRIGLLEACTINLENNRFARSRMSYTVFGRDA